MISGHSQNNFALTAFAKPAGSTNALNIPTIPLAMLGFSSAISASVPKLDRVPKDYTFCGTL
jgi:hypothetical protein